MKSPGLNGVNVQHRTLLPSLFGAVTVQHILHPCPDWNLLISVKKENQRGVETITYSLIKCYNSDCWFAFVLKTKGPNCVNLWRIWRFLEEYGKLRWDRPTLACQEEIGSSCFWPGFSTCIIHPKLPVKILSRSSNFSCKKANQLIRAPLQVYSNFVYCHWIFYSL